jgi:phenol 2-monooxygenase (NADPH)
MLDRIDLLDQMNQIGFVARNSVTFGNNGKCVTSSGRHRIFEKTHGAFQDYLLNIRLKHSEEVFTMAYERLGRHILVRWMLKDMAINVAKRTVSSSPLSLKELALENARQSKGPHCTPLFSLLV